ncbi:THAP-type domain-containing protein, partial [Trichonephila clavata]
DRCEPSTSTEMEVEAITASVGTQTSFEEQTSFDQAIDLLAKTEAEIEDLKARLQREEFVPENISDDVKMKALTSFTKNEFFGFYKFLNIEKDLSDGSTRRPIDRFFLFFVKLRTGISSEFLSVVFEIPVSTVSEDFNYVTEVVYEKLKLLFIFPCKSQVIQYMPPAFRMHFKDVRIFVECVEFEIEEPSSPKEQRMTFSHDKNANTIKGMIGITPNAAISFISELYCGNISYKQLFIESKLMNHLEPNNIVMADKGFLIANELESIGCRLQCPIFLEDTIQLDIPEMVGNSKLSNEQVTVERAIERIKQYKYFQGKLPYGSLHTVNRVFFIASMSCNFHKKIV